MNDKLKSLDEQVDIDVGSMDAKTLYPSLKIKEVCKILEEVIDDAPITFEDIDTKEICKLLIQQYNSQFSIRCQSIRFNE